MRQLGLGSRVRAGVPETNGSLQGLLHRLRRVFRLPVILTRAKAACERSTNKELMPIFRLNERGERGVTHQAGRGA